MAIFSLKFSSVIGHWQTQLNRTKSEPPDSPRVVTTVCERHVADALAVERPKDRQRRVHAVAALHAQQGPDLSEGVRLLDPWEIRCVFVIRCVKGRVSVCVCVVVRTCTRVCGCANPCIIWDSMRVIIQIIVYSMN